MDDTGPVPPSSDALPPSSLIDEADALAAVVAAEQAQITAAVLSADSAVRAAMATVAQAEKSMASTLQHLPTLDLATGGAASLQQTVEATLKQQEVAVETAIRQAEAAIAAAVASTEATLGKLP